MAREKSRDGEDAEAALAALRIVVAFLVLTSTEVWSTMALDAMTRALRTPPEGLGWFAAHVQITVPLVNASRGLVVVSALLGLVGFHARASFGLLGLGSLYLFGTSELVGAVRHDMHLLWFTLLLAVSPCGARWSVDAARGSAFSDARSAKISLWIVRALLAAVYFFPGYWKLRDAGLDWALGDNLRNQMYWKWFQNAWMPSFRIDDFPGLVRAGAASVLLLELSFPLLILSRRGRLVAAAGGIGFHVFADMFMRLGFSSLWWCYVVLVDVGGFVDWLHDGSPEPARARASSRGGARAFLPVALVGVLLLGANVTQGFRGAVQAWPFACYPTFQYVAGPEIPDLVVTALLPDGSEEELYRGTRGVWFRDPREWGTVWNLLGVYGRAPHADGLAAFYARLRKIHQASAPPPDARALRFYRAYFSVLPEQRGSPARRRVLAAELPLSVPGS